jgi:hypothetical protein
MSDYIKMTKARCQNPVDGAYVSGIPVLVGETTCGGFETLGGDKTHCFISRNK